MGETLTMIGLIILGLSILVTIHELGHFMTARWFGMRVEVFSLFFPPKIFGVKKGDTEYQLGAIPLGGYVKISGMIDESMDKEHLKTEPKEYEFRSKKAWQRLIVMLGGVIMNVVLGILIFFVIKFIYGDILIPVTAMTNGIRVEEGSVSEELGFRNGDKLIAFMGDSIRYLDEVNDPKVLLSDGAYFDIEREGKNLRIDIPGDYLNKFTERPDSQKIIFEFRPEPRVWPDTSNATIPRNAWDAGIRQGDLVKRIDSTEIREWADMVKTLESRKNRDLTIAVDRGGNLLTFNVKTDAEGHIGVRPDMERLYEIKNYNLFEALGEGTREAFVSVYTTIQGLGKVITGQADFSKSISGPVKIAQIYGKGFDKKGWLWFWQLTGMLSMVLAFMNVLPIPALDGGHVIFILVEMITGREPNPKVRIIAQQIGMVLLLLLIGFIILNDILNW